MTRSSILNGVFALAAAALLAACSPARAADWGSIKGKFVYKGDVKAEPITLTKDPEYCGEHKLVDETIALGEGGELLRQFLALVGDAIGHL